MSSKQTSLSRSIFENRNFNAKVLAQEILDNHLEKELLIFSLEKDQLVGNRAIWVLNYCAEFDFERIKPFQVKLIEHLKHKKNHSGVIRSILRMFLNQPVPKKYESFMLDKCYQYIKNPSEAIAVRAFAMTIVFNISKPYPELINEFLAVLNHLNLPEESPGIKATARKMKRLIAKL